MKNFTLVGHNPFMDAKYNMPRGRNGGITAIGDYVYVGADSQMQPGLVVDLKDPTKPTVVGQIPTIKGDALGREAMESVADLNMLVATATAGDAAFPAFQVAKEDANIGAIIYDVTDRIKPTIVAKIDVFNRSTHYLSLWRDPKKADRVLVSLSYAGSPDGVDIRVWDATGCPKSCSPKLAAEWGLRSQMGIPQKIVTKYEGGERVEDNTTHDHTYTIDGREIYMGQRRYGFFVLDSSALADNKGCNAKAATSPNAQGHCLTVFPQFQALKPFANGTGHSHGVVKIPGRPYVAISHEGYECPYGGVMFAYVGNNESYNSFDMQNQKVVAGQPSSGNGLMRGDLFPKLVSTFSTPEQNPDRCPKPGDQLPQTTGATGIYGVDVVANAKSSHDALAFPNLMFNTWYGAGLRAIDISNVFTPFEAGYFFLHPYPEVRWCNSQGGPCDETEVDAEGVPVRQKNLLPPELLAKSYPITVNGNVIYSDNNFGLYVLKYTGAHKEEVPQKGVCIAKQPNTVNLGYEPCAPYR